jgi:hypothetical protein
MKRSEMKSGNLLLLPFFGCKIVRDVSRRGGQAVPPLDMTKRIIIAAFFIAGVATSLAQESPSPTPSVSSTPTASPSPALSPSATAPSGRSVRISFLPPPLEGTISLGIYDQWGQLVRVLHQEAELAEFTVGADALMTKWDGKNDDAEDLPTGEYHARGYLVGHLKVEDLGKATNAPVDANATSTVQVKLMANPLANDERPTVSLAVGFDDENSFLKTADGLPLLTISRESNLIRAAIAKNGDKSIDVWQDEGGAVQQLRVSNVDKMMAFDCGEFELK